MLIFVSSIAMSPFCTVCYVLGVLKMTDNICKD